MYKACCLDLSIYYNHFFLKKHIDSLNLYNTIKKYNIIYTHNKSSTGTLNIDSIINKYINDDNNIIISSNNNYYKINSDKYILTQQFVNIPLAYHIDTIKNSNYIHIINSSISCIVIGLYMTNQLYTNKNNVHIYNRDHKIIK